jgi:small-conductance mechanosensitive channel/CRP-like cAMP-binding protein
VGYEELREIITSVAAGLSLFFILSLVYRAIFKAEGRKHNRLHDVVLNRTRVYVYLTLFVFSAWLTLYLLQDIRSLQPYRGTINVAFLDIALALVGIFIIESFIGLVFDFVLPDQRGLEVPTIYRDLVRVILYIAGVLLLLKKHEVPIEGLLTGSAIISIVIGLALQESLGNFFSGIFLHGTRPFNRGDWVKFGASEGMVEKVDWRATAIRTNYGDHVIYPNSVLAKLEIVNYSAPTKVTARRCTVGVHYRHPPAKVRRVLIDCALKTAKVLTTPAPVARIISYDASSVNYEIKFWIDDFADYPNIVANVYERIWYHFRREDIEIPYPIQQTFIVRERQQPIEQETQNMKLLRRVDFLSEFPEEDMRYLASRVKILTYTAGEPIIRQGDPGTSFYIIKEGHVQIQARDGEGNLFLTKDLNPGQFFGEISLLTGEPRSATVVALDEAELLRLDKEAFRKIMEDNPKADELISTVLARRQEYSQEKTAAGARAASQGDGETASTRQLFIKKIRDFFSY